MTVMAGLEGMASTTLEVGQGTFNEHISYNILVITNML